MMGVPPRKVGPPYASGLVKLTLVRHAMPEVDPAVPAPQWHLGEEGRAAARALPRRDGYHVASDEPKAYQTLGEMSDGAHVATDPGFGEVARPATWSGDYRALARAYVDGFDHEGWEPRSAVAQRFQAAVDRHTALAGGRTLIIGSHGLAMTVWLASHLTLRPSPGEFWAALRFPDLLEVDLVAGTVRRP